MADKISPTNPNFQVSLGSAAQKYSSLIALSSFLGSFSGISGIP